MISDTQWQRDMFDGVVAARNRLGLSQIEVQNLVDTVKGPVNSPNCYLTEYKGAAEYCSLLDALTNYYEKIGAKGGHFTQ